MTLRRTGLGLATVDENSTFKEVETAITDNATVTDDLLGQVGSVAKDAEARITLMESGFRPAGIAPDSQNPGLYLLSPGGQITEDPANPGFFLIGA